MAAKHRLFVFSKLESFAKARDEVKKLLKECLEDLDVDVTDYRSSPAADGACKKYRTITAVVVIDKRQTRCLITPSRRDRNVDHWDEFKTLFRETIPFDSILLFIYGDDWSKDGNDMISKKWFDIWRYNDTIAYELALRDRCFTLDQELNETHKESLKRYFSLFEKLESEEKTLKLKMFVVGNDCRRSLTAYLERHPFLAIRSPDDTTKMKYKSVFPPEVTGKRFYEEYKMKVYIRDLEHPIQVCDSENKGLDRNVKRKLESAKERSVKSTVCSRFTGRHLRRRVVILCHCAECCQLMHDDSKGYKKLLDELYRSDGIRWQAFPVYPSKTDGQDQGDSDKSLLKYKDKMILFCIPGVVIEGEGKYKGKTGRSMSGCTSDKVASQ